MVRRFPTILASVAILMWAAGAASADIGFLKVADTDTLVPGGTGTFLQFAAPSMGNGNVAFKGHSAGNTGAYSTVGGLHVVADYSTPIPGGEGSFTFVDNVSFDGVSVAFNGTGSGQQGVFADIGGLQIVADIHTPIPGGPGDFLAAAEPKMNDGHVAFLGFGPGGHNGLYTDIGGLQVVADTTTAIPGGSGTFGDFGSRGYMAFDGHYAAFRGLGSGGQQGIYSNAGGALHVVADRTTPVPGGTGTFGGFAEVSADAGNVALFGSAGDQKGIYTTIGGLNVVADKTTPVPDGPGTFTSFRSPAISNENVAFEAGFLDEFGQGRDGIFAQYEGSLIKIIDSHYPLDGKTIYNTILSDQALDDNLLAFLANFEDGSSGIFIAVIPEPGTLWLLTTGSVTLIRRRHYRR